MRFRELAEIFAEIEKTSLRNKKTEILAELLRKVENEELKAVIYLSLGRLAPLYESLELNLAGKMAVRVMAWALGEKEVEIGRLYKEKGDLGDVIYELKEKIREKIDREKSVREVYEELVAVARETGTGSQERKIRRLGKLVQSLDSLSAKYVGRLVVGRLRLGFSEMTVLDALSWMKRGDKGDRKELERVFNIRADLAEVAEIYKRSGKTGLLRVKIKPGVPIRVAKAERLGTMKEILEKLGIGGEGIAIEPKLDGMRVEIHCWQKEEEEKQGLFGGEKVSVKVFSRGMEDISHQFPEIVEAGRELRERLGYDVIVDGEAIGYDPKSGKLLPFQETVKRKRKYGVRRLAQDVPVKVFGFDVLYAGEDLLSWTYKQRRQVLERVLKEERRGVMVATEMVVAKGVEEMEKYFKKWVKAGMEGMMCKRLDGVYQAGARNFNWVKYKKAHERQLADSLDCVVMGYYRGKGKRSKFGIGAFLVGVRKGEKWLTVAKVGTGLTDEQWREMYRRVKEVEVREEEVRERYEVAKELRPDGWLWPSVVVEIEADEITKSPIHSSGYALRFPRLVRFRDDKGVEEATSWKEVVEMGG